MVSADGISIVGEDCASVVPQPPLGSEIFHPGAVGPEHHGSAPPPEDEELDDSDGTRSPKIPKSEKAVVVHDTVLALVFTAQDESALQLEPS